MVRCVGHKCIERKFQIVRIKKYLEESERNKIEIELKLKSKRIS